MTGGERTLLTGLFTQFFPSQGHYLEQLANSAVVGKCPCGCPTIDLWAEGEPQPPEEEVKVFWSGNGLTATSEPVGILLFQTHGRICRLEVFGHCDDVCAELPLPESLEICPSNDQALKTLQSKASHATMSKAQLLERITIEPGKCGG